MQPFKDISYAQGLYNMAANPDALIMMKASGGDGVKTPLYLDAQLDRNYANAVKAGKIPFMYHVAGNGSPNTEAQYFFEAVSPLAVGDGYALDLEPSCNWTVAQVLTFVSQFYQLTNTYPWIYMDISRCNASNWSTVLNLCGLWIAAPSYSFTANVPISYTYIAQQGPIVNGVDSDMAFMTLDEVKKYTYQGAPVVTTTSTTTTTTTTTTSTSSSTSTSLSTTLSTSTSTSSSTSTTHSTTTKTTTTTLPPSVPNWWNQFIKWLRGFFK